METEEVIERLKVSNPDFNLSAFIKEALFKCGGAQMEESDILAKIQEAENLIKKGEDAVIIWKKKHEEFLVNKALKEKENKQKEEERLAELEHKERLQKINEYLTGFNQDSPLWNEYQEGIKSGKWRGVSEFAKKKLNLD